MEKNEEVMDSIEQRIHLIRGIYVMVDRDLASLYGVENRVLRQAVRRNLAKFPDDFLFQLSDFEAKELISKWVSQSVIPSGFNTGGARIFAFTEQGVAMLSTVLRSPGATTVSISIMRAFVAMRRFLIANSGLFQRVDVLELRQLKAEKKMDFVLDKIEQLSPSISADHLFGTGCVWDAYSFVCDLIRCATKRIALIDNYVDDRVLTMLDKRGTGVEAEVHTRYNKQTILDFEKHNQQLPRIDYIQLHKTIHDRYLIVDDVVWLLGTSLKDIGRSLCTVIKIGFSPSEVLKMLD